ncbi:MAG: ComF family protein [Hydrogenothermaceae bacterium]|nr:ComF family protein [Hydrogenothermaceae bacterium]
MVIWNVVFPSKCEICGKPFVIKDQNLFCSNCLDQIERSFSFFCRSCGVAGENSFPLCDRCKKDRMYDYIHSFTSYSKVSQIIIKFKLSGYKNLSKNIASLIKKDLLDFVKTHNIQTVLYVPISKGTYRKRGFNHLELILREIVPNFLIKDWLAKNRDTKLQVELSKEEREKNLTDAFSLKKEAKFYGQNILVFDDILTTGSTLREIGKLLRTKKVGKIYGYVIAKT